MVARSTTDRQILDLQNAESATAWIMSFDVRTLTAQKLIEIAIAGEFTRKVYLYFQVISPQS